MEHPLRDCARTHFETAIGAGPTARNVERSVYNWAVQTTRERGEGSSWENRTFRWRYRCKLAGLLRELKRAPMVSLTLEVKDGRVTANVTAVPQLVHRLRRKELEARNIARYPPDVLWPAGPWAGAVFRYRARDLAMEAAKAKEEDYTGMFTCGKCKSSKTSYYQLQTRSADEPMVRLHTLLFYFVCVSDILLLFTDHLRHVQELREPLEVLIAKHYSRVGAVRGG